MNNIFYNRLYSLIKKLDKDIDNKVNITSLLYACACGMKLIYDSFETIKKEQYPDTMSEDMLNKYCSLLNISFQLDEAEKRAGITSALSQHYTEYEADKFIEYYSSLGEGFSLATNNFSMTLYGIGTENTELLHEIMNKLEYYLPPCVSIKLDGAGLTFDEWDSPDSEFERIDYLNIPFSVIETL